MSIFCSIVIITHNRAHDLKRALVSLGACKQIEEVQLIVVENSKETRESRSITESFTNAKSVKYLATDNRSLAKARNLGASVAEGELLCFFDDDLAFCTDTITAYISGGQKYGPDHFFGGPLTAEYEAAPLFWLRSYLPPSTLGFSLGHTERIIDQPQFLGGNCCFYRKTLLANEGFPEYLGTTENYPALAEETALQNRLLASGCIGVYLPEAMVKHHVPVQSCSYEFALHRSYRLGLTQTLMQYVEENLPVPNHTPLWMRRNMIEIRLLIWLKKLLSRPQEQIFPEEIALQHQRGALDGLQHLRSLDLVTRYQPTAARGIE